MSKEIDDLLDGVMIEEVLDREGYAYRVQNGSSGEQLNVQTCPFCGGSEHKVFINRESGLGNCFHGSCQERFNKYKLIRRILDDRPHREVIEYIRRIADQLGWRPKKKVGVQVAVEDAADWKLPNSFELPTPEGQNLKYLEDRRVSSDIAKRFNLRYCYDGIYRFTNPEGEPGEMFFGNRVLIPVYDMSGDMVTFQGRDIEGNAKRKYLFPIGLPGTGNYLFDAQNAVGKRTIIINEGAFDVIRTWANIKDSDFDECGVVGSFGISISSGKDGESQISQLLRLKSHGLQHVILMWDSDQAAHVAVRKAAAKIMGVGLKVSIALPPAGKDPGDLDRHETLTALESARVQDRLSLLRMSLTAQSSD